MQCEKPLFFSAAGNWAGSKVSAVSAERTSMHISSKAGLTLALLAGLSFAAHPAHAQNLVQDGTFEAADPTAMDGDENPFAAGDPSFDASWTVQTGTAAIDTNNDFVYAGSKSLYLDYDPTTTTTLTQNLTTTPGESYLLSFYADDDAMNPLTVTFGGTTLGPINIPQNGYPNTGPGSNASEFTPYSFSVTATSAVTALAFSADNNNNGAAIELDNISVTPAAVPEASTVVSLGLMLGFGALTLAVRRKRLSAAA